MKPSAISREIALRIALASRVIPDTQPQRLIKVLNDAIGYEIDENKLSLLSIKMLKKSASGEFSEVSKDTLIKALAFLKGEQTFADNAYEFQLESYHKGDMENSIRVAFASNTAEQLDGHFGSCTRFLIYQLSATEKRFIEVRSATNSEKGGDLNDDKSSYRAALLSDCQVLFVNSIGGPAAAKVIKYAVHPIKVAEVSTTESQLNALQSVIKKSPAPWLAKAMGHDQQSRIRFEPLLAQA